MQGDSSLPESKKALTFVILKYILNAIVKRGYILLVKHDIFQIVTAAGEMSDSSEGKKKHLLWLQIVAGNCGRYQMFQAIVCIHVMGSL